MKKTGKKLMKEVSNAISSPTDDIDQTPVSPALLGDLRSLIESTHVRVAVGINTEMVMLYWDIGDRIRKAILGNERAAYGEKIIEGLADQLTLLYGRGFTRANLFHMINFAEAFPDRKIVNTLCRQLSWSPSHNIPRMKRKPKSISGSMGSLRPSRNVLIAREPG